MEDFLLGQDDLSTQILWRLAQEPRTFFLSEPVRDNVNITRSLIEEGIDAGRIMYGINTGFGFLSNVNIDPSKLKQLQLNIIRSHACGVGDDIAPNLARGIMIAKAHSLLKGTSGTSMGCIESLLELVEYDVIPAIPEKGSVGACGDLAPLAHMSMTLIGEGEAYLNGERIGAATALEMVNLKPYTLLAKEGLSLINGTQFMTVLGAFALEEAEILARAADVISAISLDAVKGTDRAFDARIHSVRRHPGQVLVAENLRKLFQWPDSIIDSHKGCDRVQDPYSFRCIPQVHGACRDAFAHVASVLNCELNSVTDNPLVFLDGSVLSGGNFHGAPVAMALDYLAIALSELGSISERRIEKMTNPSLSGLPPFVTRDSGLNSGFMIPHVAAAALASENKILASPASVDSIPTSADKEDHVSMGPMAARKALTIGENLANILAIELLTACQAIDLHDPLTPSKPLNEVFKAIREFSPAMNEDRSLRNDIHQVKEWIKSGGVDRVLLNIGEEIL